jgi:hypothetical protein
MLGHSDQRDLMHGTHWLMRRHKGSFTMDLKQIETFRALMATGSTIAAAALRLFHSAADLAFVRFLPEGHGFLQQFLVRSGSECVMPRRYPLAALDVAQVTNLVPDALVLLGRERPSPRATEALFRRQGDLGASWVEGYTPSPRTALWWRKGWATAVARVTPCCSAARPWTCPPFQPEMHITYSVVSVAGTPLWTVAEHLVLHPAFMLQRKCHS